MASSTNLRKLIFGHPARLAYLASVGIFLWLVAGFYLPGGKGFTAFIRLGDKMSAGYLPELVALQPYLETDSYGYDGQSYVQLALRPDLDDPALLTAVDNLPYRARRILFCWTAHIIGCGNPAWVTHVFSLQNVVSWLLLGVLLLRWLPMTSWENFFRWGGVMFSFGLFISVCSALMDGPALLILACGVALSETGRRWLSTLVLAISGLGKETNLLATVAPAWPTSYRSVRTWGVAVLQGLAIAAPLLVWCWFLGNKFGWENSRGATENFAWPFAGWVRKCADTFTALGTEGWKHYTLSSLLMMVSLTVQFLFFVLRWRWEQTWWRVGALFALLMAVLGHAVWEGFPGAASRVLLPMSLAFNILVPKGRVFWWGVLLLGNITVLSVAITPVLPLRQSYEVAGSKKLLATVGEGERFRVEFSEGWYGPERSRWEYWRWSSGSAAIEIHNPHPFEVAAKIDFDLRSADQRTVKLAFLERELWSGEVQREIKDIVVSQIYLKPGANVFKFTTPQEGVRSRPDDPRTLGFSLRNLILTVYPASFAERGK